MKGILDGKDPLASTTYPQGTEQYWRDLSSQERPPVSRNLDFGDIDPLEPVTSEEIVWLKKTVNRNSALGPDGLKSADFLTIPND